MDYEDVDEWDKGLCIESRPNAVIFGLVGRLSLNINEYDKSRSEGERVNEFE